MSNVIPIICTVLSIVCAVIGWMFLDRLRQAKVEGAIQESLKNQRERLAEIGLEQKELVSRREHETLQEGVKEGVRETKEELRLIRTELGTMAKIMARATGVNGEGAA